jgi:hypothetical protein
MDLDSLFLAEKLGHDVLLRPRKTAMYEHCGTIPQVNGKNSTAAWALKLAHKQSLGILNKHQSFAQQLGKEAEAVEAAAASRAYWDAYWDGISETSKQERMALKTVQLKTLFHALSHGRPITHYQQQEDLLLDLQLPSIPAAHWSQTASWELADSISEVVRMKLQATVLAAPYISISMDEVTAIDTTQWLGMHVYISRKYCPSVISLKYFKVVC